MAGSVSVCDTAVLEYTPGLRTSVCCCIVVNSPCCWLAYCHMFCSGFQHSESSYSFFSQVFCLILFPLLCSQWAFLPIPAAGFISRYGCAKPEEGDSRISVARKVCFARRLTFIILQFPTNLGIDHVIHTTLEEIRACRLLVFKWRYHDHTLTVHILPITIIRLEKKIKERNAQCFGSPFTTLWQDENGREADVLSTAHEGLQLRLCYLCLARRWPNGDTPLVPKKTALNCRTFGSFENNQFGIYLFIYLNFFLLSVLHCCLAVGCICISFVCLVFLLVLLIVK